MSGVRRSRDAKSGFQNLPLRTTLAFTPAFVFPALVGTGNRVVLGPPPLLLFPTLNVLVVVLPKLFVVVTTSGGLSAVVGGVFIPELSLGGVVPPGLFPGLVSPGLLAGGGVGSGFTAGGFVGPGAFAGGSFAGGLFAGGVGWLGLGVPLLLVPLTLTFPTVVVMSGTGVELNLVSVLSVVPGLGLLVVVGSCGSPGHRNKK